MTTKLAGMDVGSLPLARLRAKAEGLSGSLLDQLESGIEDVCEHGMAALTVQLHSLQSSLQQAKDALIKVCPSSRLCFAYMRLRTVGMLGQGEWFLAMRGKRVYSILMRKQTVTTAGPQVMEAVKAGSTVEYTIAVTALQESTLVQLADTSNRLGSALATTNAFLDKMRMHLSSALALWRHCVNCKFSRSAEPTEAVACAYQQAWHRI